MIFAAFLAAPLTSLAVLGYPPSAPEKITVSGVDWSRFLRKRDVRSETITAMVTNSPLARSVLRIRGEFDYEVLHYVNRSGVASGRDGWLYFADDFVCFSSEELVSAVNQVEALAIVAEGVGIDLLVSVSPDKTVVYPEHLGRLLGGRAACKLDEAEALRLLMARNRFMMDHLPALREDRSGRQLYYPADTHWNELGAELALRQLALHYLGIDIGVPEDGEIAFARHTGDLGRTIAIEIENDAPQIEDWWKARVEPKIGAGIGDALVIHDSFYEVVEVALRSLFGGSKVLRVDDAAAAEAVLDQPSRILVNTVERSLVYGALHGPLSWNDVLGRALLSLSRMRAERCDYSSSHAYVPGERERAGIVLPQGTPCIQVKSGGDAEWPWLLLLPDEEGNYAPGRHVELHASSPGGFAAVVLPSEFGGRSVAIAPSSPGAEPAEISVEVGHLPR